SGGRRLAVDYRKPITLQIISSSLSQRHNLIRLVEESTSRDDPTSRSKWRMTMRFMMLMIPRGYEAASPGTVPPAEAVAAVMEYTEALKEAGVLIMLAGLHPPSMGARVSFPGGKPIVTDGPFTEAKEVIGGYWMIEVNSLAEAIAWAKKCPASSNETIEIRQ